MKELVPDTPVIVGVGFEQETAEDPAACAEPSQLMVRAVRRAATDAGSEALLAQIESISVPQGMWEYRNPGRLIADALGCPSARSILSDLGVLQLSLLSDLCRAIAAGEQHVGVITGGEAKFRELRGAMLGRPPATPSSPRTRLNRRAPHVVRPWASDLEARAGLASGRVFAIMESALRHAEGSMSSAIGTGSRSSTAASAK
jgi:acetyl-CoA C-acetyltransferase